MKRGRPTILGASGSNAMMDFPDEMTIVVVLFFVVFALNIVPAFAPPTWVTAFRACGLALAAVGATAHPWPRRIGQAIANDRPSEIPE